VTEWAKLIALPYKDERFANTKEKIEKYKALATHFRAISSVSNNISHIINENLSN